MRSLRLACATALASLMIVLCPPLHAQSSTRDATAARVQPRGDPLTGFDAYVAQAARDWDVPGLAIAVIKDGRTVFAKGYGVRELGRRDPVNEHTLFAIASTTKAFTAAAVGMLVDEGKVRWDDPVTRHLPWFQLSDPAVTREVTVRDLLTHRAGVGNADFLWYEQDGTPREIVTRLRYMEPAYSLRSSFVYQNVMYAAAGEVVAAASGMPWQEFIRTRFLRPLGMNRTVTTLAETQGVANVASPHEYVGDTLRVIGNSSVDPAAAAGSIWSSVHDMARWLAFLQRGCVTESGQRLLREATCEELFRPQTLRRDGSPAARLVQPHWSTYGLGWFQHDYEGRKVDYHTGSLDGMVAIAGLVRDGGIGVYMLGNRDHAELRHALMYRVFDLYDGEPPRDWNRELKAVYDSMDARRDSTRRAAAAEPILEVGRPSLPLERYVGTYSDPLRGTVEVTMRNGGLYARYGRRSGPVEHVGYDTFRARWETEWRGSATLQFIVSENGVPERLEFQRGTLRRERERTPDR